MQRITNADLSLDLSVRQSRHDRAALYVRLACCYVPGRHAYPQLEPGHDSRPVPRVKWNARLHRLLQQLLLFLHLLVRFCFDGQLIVLVTSVLGVTQLRTMLLHGAYFLYLLALREYAVEGCFEALLLRAVNAAGVLAHRVVVVDQQGILAVADHVVQGI